MNRYLYADSDPVNRADPSGRAATGYAAGGLIGALLSRTAAIVFLAGKVVALEQMRRDPGQSYRDAEGRIPPNAHGPIVKFQKCALAALVPALVAGGHAYALDMACDLYVVISMWDEVDRRR